MGVMASQITSFTILYSTVYSGADQRKHQCSTSLAFVQRIHWWPMNSLYKWPETQKMFHLMTSSCVYPDHNNEVAIYIWKFKSVLYITGTWSWWSLWLSTNVLWLTALGHQQVWCWLLIFEVKLTFEMVTVGGQQHSFWTHEWMFLWKCQSFWDRKCLKLRETQTPNLRIHAECSDRLSYQGQTFAVPCFWILALVV